MFKKFKDKLAEEVKSSPQRIQQFAQAAQAAVTSASSSISDITNNDLFSIGDNDASGKLHPSSSQQSAFQDVNLLHHGSTTANDLSDLTLGFEHQNQRQRRLSNSSLASDVSFRLPSYESPSMYHLQSDMEVSASEAEEKGFTGSTVNLDRVTKEQLYAAYRKTQDRCTKYKNQYADLARHYKLLERENAKARNVLVETQDKALRRISELREQCSLEQSAKAHLERALRIEIEERNMKIDTLNTKLNLLNAEGGNNNRLSKTIETDENSTQTNNEKEIDLQLIDLSGTNSQIENNDSSLSEIAVLNNKVEKMEHLLNKYKESMKTTKEKNAQMTTELQILSSELENKIKENEQLKSTATLLTGARHKIQELNNAIEELQNNYNSTEFSKNKEISILENNSKDAQDEITQLRNKIEILSKREEEYAISLAENKLSIHKELESKEALIKSLKDSLTNSQNEVQSLNIVIDDYKHKLSSMEEERARLNDEVNGLTSTKTQIKEIKTQIEVSTQRCQTLENDKIKMDEEYKCLQLQMKQETAEKLAMKDRNTYLESRNSQLTEENQKKCALVNNLERELVSFKNLKETAEKSKANENDGFEKAVEEANIFKMKNLQLESEMQEEREELVKLQSVIEKLLSNHEELQKQNVELNIAMTDLKHENVELLNKITSNNNNLKLVCKELQSKLKILSEAMFHLSKETISSLGEFKKQNLPIFVEKITLLNNLINYELEENFAKYTAIESEKSLLQVELADVTNKYKTSSKESDLLKEENTILKSKIIDMETVYSSMNEKIEHLNSKYQEILNELNETKNVKDVKYLSSIEKLSVTEKENNELREELNTLLSEKTFVHDQLTELKKQYEINIENLEKNNKHKDELSNKLKEFDELKKYVSKLEEQTEVLSEENTSLKKISEKESLNFKDLENEINDIRKSHAEIEKEKDRLNLIIENLEINERNHRKCVQNDKGVQTDLLEQNIPLHEGLIATSELITLEQTVEKPITALSSSHNLQTKMPNEDTTSTSNAEQLNYLELKTEFDILKDENKRLKSDIEALQTYLTKVSKENSQLNDKLRDSIASSEGVPMKNENLTGDLEIYKTEIESSKEKIQNLIHENALLVEENLELKDQLQTQSYDHVIKTPQSKNNSDSELLELREKYNNIVDLKFNLETRVKDLEQMNQSISGNMYQMQTNNEKLRLSNEKLERRLDEALVSLRHLHSLQENTELEYLKNILYEYLTGTGTHSITLAKVLAAVVKFDDTQTELVLQKEKERQGFLRQLGLI